MPLCRLIRHAFMCICNVKSGRQQKTYLMTSNSHTNLSFVQIHIKPIKMKPKRVFIAILARVVAKCYK